MDEQDKIRISHMLEACNEALGFIEGHSKESFSSDRMRVLAVIKDIEIIGEAASKVSKETQLTFDNIPWREIVLTRNRLIHGYFSVNIEIIWNTLAEDLPALKISLERALT